jgi:O-antigen/teichoic acid export membrane protein
VVAYARIGLVAQGVKLILSAIFLATGWGLLSVPIATIVSSFLQRALSRRACLRLLSRHPAPVVNRAEIAAILKKLWPNTWRLGVHLLGSYLGTYGYTFLCARMLGLAANAQYGISQQILNIAVAMSMAWVSVKWPMVGQLRARADTTALRKLFWPRVWLQVLTYFALAAVAIPATPFVLGWLGKSQIALPGNWFAVLAIGMFLDTQFAIWTNLIATTNRLPFLWANVATSIVSVLAAAALIKFTSLGIGAVIFAPLVCGSMLNYWFWPRIGARTIETNWWKFMFSKPC